MRLLSSYPLLFLLLVLPIAGCGSSTPSNVDVTFRAVTFGDLGATEATISYVTPAGRQDLGVRPLPWTQTATVAAGSTVRLEGATIDETGAGRVGFRIEILANGQLRESSEVEGAAGPTSTAIASRAIEVTVP
ncbi:hypothetical protein BH23BAC4_BH23BAC4_04630 [soil metagenome]